MDYNKLSLDVGIRDSRDGEHKKEEDRVWI